MFKYLSPKYDDRGGKPHDIYIARDALDNVMYVGQSFHALRRIGQHRYTSPWGRSWARIELRSFPTRHDALQFEAALIAAHNPPHNKDHPHTRLECSLCAPEPLAWMLDRYGQFSDPTNGLSHDRYLQFVAHAQWAARGRILFAK